MLRVTADIFSGRPNPSWIVDENEAKAVLKEIANNRGVVADAESVPQGLGYRGLTLELLTDDVTETSNLPSVLQIANGSSLYESKGLEIAERLIRGMSSAARTSSFLETSADLDENLQTLILDQLGTVPSANRLSQADMPDSAKAMVAEGIEAAAACQFERVRFNPGFWNDPAVQPLNNCYNYATNRRTNTFAQPGRATGFFPYPMDCPSVMQGALSDGAHKRFDCFPDLEKPRYLMALVIWPGVDYHWYRYHSEGFWGHKPGSTAARNTDNSGNVIANPETCDRGPYTIFCGYFYSAKSMKVN